MCWNQDISINTFVFACLSLLFIFFTQSYSKYKLHAFDNPFVYLFLLEVAIMQLIEFFLWRNLKNNKMNQFLSILASIVVTMQAPTVMLMIPDINIRYFLLIIYAIFLVVYFEFRRLYSPIHFHTSIGKTGHLQWDWINITGYANKIMVYIYLFLYGISFLFINNIELSVMGLLSLFISLVFYFKDNTFASMWCWITNVFLLYFIVNILLIKPFYEYNGLC